MLIKLRSDWLLLGLAVLLFLIVLRSYLITLEEFNAAYHFPVPVTATATSTTTTTNQ